jgi:hypothetical protein
MNLSQTPIVRFTTGLAQGTARQTERLARTIAGGAAGIFNEARRGGSAPKPDMDDITLARKVETEIFRPRGAPKGSVDVNVVEGVVYLRGEVKRPAQIKSLEAQTRAIPEVRGVENLLHLPKTPSPTRADTPPRMQKNPRSPKPPPRKRSTAVKTRVTAEAPAETVGTGRRGPATAPETDDDAHAARPASEAPEGAAGAPELKPDA